MEVLTAQEGDQIALAAASQATQGFWRHYAIYFNDFQVLCMRGYRGDGVIIFGDELLIMKEGRSASLLHHFMCSGPGITEIDETREKQIDAIGGKILKHYLGTTARRRVTGPNSDVVEHDAVLVSVSENLRKKAGFKGDDAYCLFRSPFVADWKISLAFVEELVRRFGLPLGVA